MHDTDWTEAFRPVGNQLLESTLTRRSFIGACIGIPVVPLLLGTSTASTAATLERIGCESSLRFTEDKDGLNVTWYPALEADPSAQTDGSNPCNSSQIDPAGGDLQFPGIDASARTWRIVRKAFGPGAKFTLRRLAVRPEVIFQLKVENARFGELKSATHWLTFTHLSEKRRWYVRLRTDLWCAPKHLRSNEAVGIPFEQLSLRVGEENSSSAINFKIPLQESECFCIDTDASVLGAALQSVLEQHVRVEGPLRLTLARNGVWSLIPRKAGRKALGKIQLVDGALVAPHGISMAWCEPESDDGPDAAIAKYRKSTHNDPVFVAWGELEATAKAIVLGNAPGPRVTLEALHTIASTYPSQNPTSPEELTPAASAQASAPDNPTKSKRVGTGQPTQQARKCRADAKSSGSYRAEAVKAFVERHGSLGADPPQWRYVRRDWLWKDSHPAGMSTVRAAWMAHFAGSAKSPVLGPLCIREGALTHSKSSESKVGFAGRLDGDSWWLKSRIGWLRVQGWTSDASEIDPMNASARTHHPLMTAGCAAFGSLLSSLDVPLILLESELAPSGCDFSKLTFAPTGLRAVYASDARNASTDLRASDSYLWLGNESDLGDLPLAHIDLTQARVEVARTLDLARLAFMFAGLHLDIAKGAAWITDTRSSCRVRRRVEPGRESDPLVLDTRPVLVVEFPPQHVFEEAIFRPSVAPLPDVALKEQVFRVKLKEQEKEFSTSLPKLLRELERLNQVDDRKTVREAYAAMKVAEQKNEKSAAYDPSAPFEAFSKRFSELFKEPEKAERWPADQHIYIGALNLPPDLAAEARKANDALRKEVIRSLLKRTLDDADRLVELLNSEKPSLNSTTRWFWQKVYEYIPALDPANKNTHPLPPLDKARLIEQAVEGVMQSYADFRDFYAEQMVLRQGQKNYFPQDMEFFSSANRKDLKLSDGYPLDDIHAAYLAVLEGTQDPAQVMRARLSGTSRLAFHVDCGSRPGIDVEDGDAHVLIGRLGSRRSGGTNGTRLPFSFDALTDWGHYDLAVTPRARQAAAFDDSGVLIRREISDSGLEDDSAGSDVMMLKSLGIRSGQVEERPQGPGRSRDWGKSLRTIQERLADVEASLRVVPDDLQTAIELPARLILSPSQKAQWRTPRRWCPDSSRPVPLWSATLDTDAANPLVRAVASPDMRPEFVRYGLERRLLSAPGKTGDKGQPLHSPVGSAPPRGPRAPWTLGFEESDTNISPIEDLYVATSQDGTPQPSKDSVCGPSASIATPASVPASTAASSIEKPEMHQVVEYLCRRQHERAGYQKHAVFRSTLDAYDRHEIVLLSSAWGLPVRGRREKSGELQALRVSSQVELPPEWRLLDAQAGTASYRPRALKVRELTLTALGGSLRHDSDFVPPSAARHIIHGPLFDSMSVERWQHWTVLGRDVFAEVVYKGYLFPIGHRASLVKQTERVFIRPVGGGLVRAYLRQRMFIRVARPDKTFPAYGQPHGGRKFPGGVVSMLTATTPDIVDPTEDTQKLDAPAPSGRLFANQAGLVFWPRTARLDGADVAFDLQIQGAATRAKLIFVDNVAANRAELMDELVAYYNRLPSPDLDQTNQVDIKALQPLVHMRSLDMRGQSLRYCDEVKPGSASHKTLAWTLKATGCVGVTSYLNKRNTQINQWEGLVERYDDPMLEGADQPPFFPAIETARIRIDQVERLTNGAPQAAIAQFDGWYVKNGFEADRISREKDALEIYFDIVNPLNHPVTMDMGSCGDRSGGVMRPAGQVIALSRQRGPLAGTAVVSTAGTTGSVTGAGGYPVKPPERGRMQRFVGGAKSAPGQPDDARKAFEQFFSTAKGALDTRILGLVSLKDLVQHLNIADAASDLPMLREAVEYGLAGLDASAQVMRTQVIVPLHDVAKELDKQWQKVGADALARLPGFVGGMEDVFPDVDRALTDLLNVLSHTAASTDDAAVFASLGEIYECGRRLMDACGRVAANPLDHLQLAVRHRLQGLGNGIERFSEELESLRVDVLIAPLVESLVAAQTVQRLLGGAFDWLASLAESLDELRKELKDLEPVRAAFDQTLSLLKEPPPLLDELRNAIALSFNPKDASEPLPDASQIIRDRLDSVRTWLQKASVPLVALPKPDKPKTAGAVSTAIEFFKVADARVLQAQVALKDVATRSSSEYRQAVNTLSTILQIAATVRQLTGDRKAVLALFSQAVSDYLVLLVGPRLTKLPSPSDAKSLAQRVLEPIKDVADSAMLSIADPLKPANPEPPPSMNGNFTIPTNWQVPGKNSSLVDQFHDLAKAVQAALQKATKATKKEEALDARARNTLAMIGDNALHAEWLLHRSTMSLRIAAHAMADFDEARLQSAMHQADAAYQALERLGEDIASTLQHLVSDLLVLEIDNKIIDPVVTPARRLVRQSLSWLEGRSNDLNKRLDDISNLHAPWAQVLQPWLYLSGQYSVKIKEAIDSANNRSNAEWLNLRGGILPALSGLPDPASAAKASSVAIVTLLERLVAQQVMDWASSLAVPTEAATNALMAAFRPAVAPVSDAYAKLLKARNDAYDATIGTPAEWVNDALLLRADPTLVFLPGKAPDEIATGVKTDSDQLHWDSESLKNLVAMKQSSPNADRFRAVRVLDYIVQGWRTGQSTPLRIAKQVQQISLEEVRAKLMALINFSAIREEIEERIKLLIPSAATLSYDFSTSIASAAGGSGEKAKVFRPKEGCALSVKSRARIDLREGGKPSFQSIGEMGAFDIQLLGSFDALTLHFKGVRFVSQGGTPDCDLQYDGFTIGEKLKFLEQLTPFFGSKPGSGFYLKPLDTGIGLEAGYGLNLGTFSIGNLAIFNVSLNAAARLPFDNRGATFVASLSRRDSPFTIAIAPYGGSGFFALEADTKGIVGFEASFEYGGAGAFFYGPLEGQGRLMVGAYIRSSRNSTRIFATFYVGGSASIWIFSFGASLYVNAEQQGSTMVGSATYTFSFSLGIVDYDYKVAVNVNLNLDGSSGNKSTQDNQTTMLGQDPPVRLASIEPDAWNPGTTTSDFPLHFVSLEPSRKRTTRAKPPAHQQAIRKVDTVCPSSNWAEYSKYFDLDLKVRMEDY